MIGEPQEAQTSWGFAEGLRGCASLALATGAHLKSD